MLLKEWGKLMKVPFSKLYCTGKEITYIKEVLERGETSGDGHFTHLVSSYLEQAFLAPRVLMTTSATHALELAALLIGLKPGDEVIMPSYTFPSTANAVMLTGARPVFAEIKEETLNIDPVDIEKRITGKTRAIIPVHYAGIACEIDRILEIASRNGLYVIEDAAQGVNAQYRGKYLGTWGDIGCYSFHGTKNYHCGEGGAIVINNQQWVEQAEIIRDKGTDRIRFLRGEVNNYSWVEQGSSYLPSEILMAFLYAQLEQLEDIKNRRKVIHEYYFAHLQDYLGMGFIKGMTRIPEECKSNYHSFYILLENERLRNRVMTRLQELGVSAFTHYLPLHSSPMGQKLGYRPEELPLTERVSKTLLRLPLYTGMTPGEMEYVVSALKKVFREL